MGVVLYYDLLSIFLLFQDSNVIFFLTNPIDIYFSGWYVCAVSEASYRLWLYDSTTHHASTISQCAHFIYFSYFKRFAKKIEPKNTKKSWQSFCSIGLILGEAEGKGSVSWLGAGSLWLNSNWIQLKLGISGGVSQGNGTKMWYLE